MDELDAYLDEALRDPAFRVAYEDARDRSETLASLVRLRKSLRLPQVEVARRMKTTQSSISELEGGGTDPQLSTLQRYARALGARLRVDLVIPPERDWIPARREA